MQQCIQLSITNHPFGLILFLLILTYFLLYADISEQILFQLKFFIRQPEAAVSGTGACNCPGSGDLSTVEPPVPIPNTEVKRCSADGSLTTGLARVGRRQDN